jgi:hypothetical protein
MRSSASRPIGDFKAGLFGSCICILHDLDKHP